MKKGITYIILFCLISLGFNAQSDSLKVSDYAAPQSYAIGGIEVSGANHTDKNVIRLLSGLVVGDKVQIPGDKITGAIKTLWKQGLFENIEIYQEKIIGNDIFLRIDVTERPRMSKFSFKGKVRKNEADEIRAKIRLVKEKVITDYALGFVKNTVRDYYVNKGFYNAKVNITQEPDRLAKTPHTIIFQSHLLMHTK